MNFIYKQEYWFANAWINRETAFTQLCEIIKTTILTAIHKEKQEKFRNWVAFGDKTLDPAKLITMSEYISIEVDWIPYLDSFSRKSFFCDNQESIIHLKEECNEDYQIGYFLFTVEYFKSADHLPKKNTIEPAFLHVFSGIALLALKDVCKTQTHVCIETKNPLYIFAISNKTTPDNIEWNNETIENFRVDISKWTQLYSGYWKDYTAELYLKRSNDNLAYRSSELHFIRRTCGFLFVTEQNYNDYFESYYKETLICSTAQIRALVFAMSRLNTLLDEFRAIQASHTPIDTDILDANLKELEYLLGILNEKMSSIRNDLDYNQKGYYKRVLAHLIHIFNVEIIFERLHFKFNTASESLQIRYQQELDEKQQRLDTKMFYLTIFFGLGIISDIASIFLLYMDAQLGGQLELANISLITLLGILGIFIAVGFISVILTWRRNR